MSEFCKVATVDELSPGQMKLVEVDERLVILIQCDDGYFCIDDVCTHDGGTLSDGELRDCRLACPRHGAEFDVRSGKALTMPATVDTGSHEVKVDSNEIFVRIGNA